MGMTTAGCYRDKLAMRVIARALGFLVPEFCRVLNYDVSCATLEPGCAALASQTLSECPALWIRRIEEPEQLWRILEDLGDEQSRYLLEQFVPGDIFHVDSIVSESNEIARLCINTVGRRGCTSGGVFTTRTVDRNPAGEERELTALNSNWAPSLGMVRGVTLCGVHSRSGRWSLLFLEIAAVVGGAFIADSVEAATGVEPVARVARLEVGNLRGETYVLPEVIESYARAVCCAWPRRQCPTPADLRFLKLWFASRNTTTPD